MSLTNVPKIFTTAELDKLLSGFPKDAVISRTDIVASVHAPKSLGNTQVLSAALVGRDQWHVRAVPGLLMPVVKEQDK